MSTNSIRGLNAWWEQTLTGEQLTTENRPSHKNLKCLLVGVPHGLDKFLQADRIKFQELCRDDSNKIVECQEHDSFPRFVHTLCSDAHDNIVASVEIEFSGHGLEDGSLLFNDNEIIPAGWLVG